MADPVVRDVVYRTYWAFANERQRIFESRLAGLPAPWTHDTILDTFRFCNVFRAADRVSQHLIRHAAFGDATADIDDVFLRVVLHRLFSRPSTWEMLEDRLGSIDTLTFDAQNYGSILDHALREGQRIYTNAFILCATPAYGFDRKHRNHLALIKAMLDDGVPARVAAAATLEDVYLELRGWPLIGPFMAYQLAIDLNYSPIIEFSEDDFVVPGPGAERGLAKVFLDLGDRTPAEAILWLVEQQHVISDRLELDAPSLFGRPLHAVDCQNLLCEVDKYCREAYPALTSNRSRIKQRFVVDSAPYELFFPPSWGINERIPERSRRVVRDPAPV